MKRGREYGGDQSLFAIEEEDENDEGEGNDEEPKRTKKERHVENRVEPSGMESVLGEILWVEVVDEAIPCCDVDL